MSGASAFERLTERGYVQQCTHPEELAAALAAGPVTFYCGFDPTASSLHAGSMFPLMAMANLQRMGHRVIALVGGGTARVGDPSGKTELRQMLTDEQIATNSAGLREQISRFLDLDGDRGLLVDNAEWLLELKYIPFLRDIGRQFSVNRMLAGRGLQAADGARAVLHRVQLPDPARPPTSSSCTAATAAAWQIGGDDQWGNIVAGVDLVRRMEGAQVWGLTHPLLTTASGAKMGKTASGAVWLDADRCAPFDYWQFWYNVDDRDVVRLLKLYTFVDDTEIARLAALQGADIREAKRVLANEATALVHGAEAAAEAEAGARAMQGGRASDDLPTVPLAEPTRLLVALERSGDREVSRRSAPARCAGRGDGRRRSGARSGSAGRARRRGGDRPGGQEARGAVRDRGRRGMTARA